MAASSISIVSSSPPPWMMSSRSIQSSSNSSPSASLSLVTGSRTRSNFSMNAATSSITRPGMLHCSFLPSSPLSFPSSFSGISLGLDLNSNIGVRKDTAGGLVVRAGKAALCQTKRNRSRKSLARTHGFRRRMRTTSGRAVLKRRRAKGRKVLCTKSYPNSGKGA